MDQITLVVGGVSIDVDKEIVSKGIEAGKIELATDHVVYAKPDFDAYQKNIADAEYKKGKTAGEEMLIKGIREQHKLEFEGKSADKLVEALKIQAINEAKIEPDKRIQELEADKQKLLTNYQTVEKEFTTFKDTIAQKEARQKKDSELIKAIAKHETTLDAETTAIVLKSKGVDVDFDEAGQLVALLNGQVAKSDKTLQPLPIDEIISLQLKQTNLLKPRTGGNGGGDEPGKGNASDYDKFAKLMAEQGIIEGSLQFNEKMIEAQKSGTLKM